MLKTNTERYHFADLAELRDWLNAFKSTDLGTVYPADHADHFTLDWLPQTLSDGSEVINVRIQTT